MHATDDKCNQSCGRGGNILVISLICLDNIQVSVSTAVIRNATLWPGISCYYPKTPVFYYLPLADFFSVSRLPLVVIAKQSHLLSDIPAVFKCKLYFRRIRIITKSGY